MYFRLETAKDVCYFPISEYRVVIFSKIICVFKGESMDECEDFESFEVSDVVDISLSEVGW